jgi:nitrogen PTS system EIIA component
MKLTDIVAADAVITNLKATTKDEAIREIVNSLRAAGKVATEHTDAIISAIMKREELGSTGIGRGVAVPHTKHSSVDSIVATVALSEAGLDFAALDGEVVHILFLLISPPDRPGEHLRGLETITRHLKSDEFCSFMRQCNTAEKVIDLLKEGDEKQF